MPLVVGMGGECDLTDSNEPTGFRQRIGGEAYSLRVPVAFSGRGKGIAQ
jgi:hypothetical protein